MTDPETISLNRAEISPAMLAAAQPYEDRFGDEFNQFIHFSKEEFSRLHASDGDPMVLPSTVFVASQNEPSILTDMEVLQHTANASYHEVAMKREYYQKLLDIYGKLHIHPHDIARDEGTLCVGIEREGRILAEAMNCLPKNRSMRPHCKRIPFEGGLLIGLYQASPDEKNYDQCLIVDGAIASGATIMAMMWQLRNTSNSISIASVHGPCQGLRAIIRFGRELGLEVNLYVGHATVGLNGKFYAVNPGDGSLILGDVGDTISDLEHPSRAHE